ncbi:MAG: ABC transporter ATP-binding protein [Anaerolineales bacterium]|nr:ABC transporter ATP-binding protein [Anaerolineales bacterium]
MINFSHVTKKFGDYAAVADLSLTVEPQAAVALWGPNGAGKTTVIKCLLGLLKYKGSIAVNDFDVQKQGRQARGQIGYVPQAQSFYNDMGTLELTRYFGQLKRAPAQQPAELLEQVGLAEHLDKKVGALSGGMKQRLAVALALLGDPPVIVMDEPTSNLDAGARDALLQLLANVKAAGKTIVFTSHRLEEIETLADRVLVMDRGQVRLTCTAAELPKRLGWRSQVKLRVPAASLDTALTVLQDDGFTVRRNGVGVIVDVAHGDKARPIHALSAADICVVDFVHLSDVEAE